MSEVAKLPAKVVQQLDRGFLELYSGLEPPLRTRIVELIERASKVRIKADKLVRFAFLRAVAEQESQGDEISQEHTRRSRAELIAASHGLNGTPSDESGTRKIHGASRRARQMVAASLRGIFKRWQKLEQLVAHKRAALPARVQKAFLEEELAGVRKKILGWMRAAELDQLDQDKLDQIEAEETERSLSTEAQTYIWWCHFTARYQGKWADMHALAIAWRMTAAHRPSFEKIVRRICKGRATTTLPFGETGIAVLRQKGT